MANMVVKRIGVLSLAKIEAVVLAVFGFIIGLFYALFFGAMGAMMPAGRGGAAMGGIGLLAIIIIPVLYGVFGFIAGAIGAVIYNFAAGFMGGIELELENAAPNYQYGAPPPHQYGGPPPPPPPPNYGAPYGQPPR